MNIDTRTAAPSLPIETVTPIKPSEAIRLGCLIVPIQSTDGYGVGDKGCVHVAMMLGFGRPRDGESTDLIPNEIQMGRCPAGGCPSDRKWWTNTFHLNDDHRWSRERIADWLEGLGL